MKDKKQITLDVVELEYLLDTCLRGSHLRSNTVRRFVDEWYDLFTEVERIRLFEWTIRLTYDQRWTSDNKAYKPHFEHLPCPEWEKRKQPGVDYDTNIIDITL